jgi:hypothetical protein
MKKLILTVALGVACASAFAQGTLNFANAAAGVNAPITVGAANGPRATGPTYTVDLWWGAAGTTDSTTLTELNQPATFNSGAQSGYFTGGARTITGVAGGTAIVVQVRAWDTTAPTLVGASGLFNVTLATAPATPANLVGLNSFFIPVVPEPSSFALAGLGAAALVIFRRRK